MPAPPRFAAPPAGASAGAAHGDSGEHGGAVAKPGGDLDDEDDDGFGDLAEPFPEASPRADLGFDLVGSGEIEPAAEDAVYGATSSRRVSGLRAARFVHFDEGKTRKRKRKRCTFSRLRGGSANVFFSMWEVLDVAWGKYVRPFVIATSIYELWSMGIWFGFLFDSSLITDSLIYIAITDIVSNVIYIIDTTLVIMQIYLKEWREKRDAAKQRKDGKQKRHRQKKTAAKQEEQLAMKMLESTGVMDFLWKNREWVKVICGLVLAAGMFPVQTLLLKLLRDPRKKEAWELALVLSFRLARVIWAFKDCAQTINQQEMEVYVDIKMHGTSDSSGNRARILVKQFLVVVFFGHFFGCLSHFLSQVGGLPQQGIRFEPDSTRAYMSEFEEESMIEVRNDEFWTSYLLALYKGFNLNYEDLKPERPIDLMIEVLVSIFILLMKSYCIGSFFKFHQKREFEVQKFSKLMDCVRKYLDLYEMPPSLRKTVINHFRFQQANHRKIQTLQVISNLPMKVQQKLREFEVLPTVMDRNPSSFGLNISTEYCLNISLKLGSFFLQPGEVIFVESEVPRELVFLDSGAVSFSRSVVHDGRKMEQLMKYVRADRKDDPTALGDVAVILGAPHFFSARVRAGTEVVVLAMPRADFDEINASFPQQLDTLIENAAAAHSLDAKGRDMNGSGVGEYETDTDAAIRADVRRRLLARQSARETAFTYAASSGDTKLVRDLLEKRVDANVMDYDGRSALHLAASEGRSEVLEALLEFGGNPNLKDRWGSTPMQDALKSRSMGAAKILQKHQGVLELSDPAGELCTHASEGNTIRMQQLLDFGVDPNAGDYDGRTALHLSASEGHLPVCTFLTYRGCDVNVRDRWGATPIQDAIRNGFPIVAALLYARGSRPDDDFAAGILCDAASRGDLPMLEILFQTGVDMDQGDYDARTPLHLVAAEGKVLALDYLVNTAGAYHSPVDRWGSTPLQDALTNGHELCVEMLINMGADLGESADAAMRKKVQDMSNELGFGSKSGIKAYTTAVAGLRRKISAHVSLVRQGRARGDIFDVREAAVFNRSVINGSVRQMHSLCKDAVWLSELLSVFERAAQPLWQLMKVVRDADHLLGEVHFWAEVNRATRSNAKRKKGASKDAQDMVFHKAFLSGMRFTNGLVSFVDTVASQVIARVEELRIQLHSGQGKPTPVSVILAQEVLRELGMLDEDDEKNHDDMAAIRKKLRSKDSKLTKEKLAMKIENFSRVLAAGDHMTLAMFRGPLSIRGFTVKTELNDPTLNERGNNKALTLMSVWLEKRSRTVLSGKPPFKELPPPASKNADVHDLYGALWPVEDKRKKTFAKPIELSKSQSIELQMEPEMAVSHLVASELVMLGLGTLIADVWEEHAQMTEHQREATRDRKSIATLLGKDTTHDRNEQIRKSDLQEIGRIFCDTAKVCRGMFIEDAEERNNLLKRLRKKAKDAKLAAKAAKKKEAELKAQQQEDGGAAGPTALKGKAEAEEEAEEEDEDEENMQDVSEEAPIRVAKILALDKMSLDELAVLVDVDDLEGKERAGVLGEVSRQRFVLNMLRCLVNHNEMQQEVINASQSHKVSEAVKLEQEVVASCRVGGFGGFGMQKMSEDEELTLLQELQELQEEFSDRGDDSDRDESHDQAGMAMYDLGRPSGLDTLDVAAVEDKKEKLTLWRALTWPFRFFGKEGRNRRKQKRIAKRFKELDDDGDGIGTAEMAQLLAVAFNHTLGLEQELRYAYRVFELLNKADVGDLVTLPELFQVLPALEEEIKDQQRKNRRAASAESAESSTWAITRIASRMVIPPESQLLFFWDKVRRLVVIYYIIEVPIHFSFLGMANVEPNALLGWTIVNGVCDAFMALNIILTFFRGFVHETKGVVTVFQDIRIKYVFGAFWLDLLACCPLDLWAAETAASMDLLARPRAALRMVRLLHMRHLGKTRSNSTTSSDSTEQGFFGAAFSMSVFILIIAHFAACVWWLLGTRYDAFDPSMAFNATNVFNTTGHVGRGSWTFAYVHRAGESPIGDWTGATPFWWQYLVSFYWSAGRLTSQSSPGNLFGASWVELGWTCILFLLNVAINGYCDGILVDKVIAGDEQAIEAKAMRKIVDEYLQVADLAPELIRDIRHAAEECGKVVERERMENTIAALPHSLKQRVARRIFVPRFNTPLFQPCSESFLVELGAQSRIITFGKDQPLAFEGEFADQLNILVEGRIAIINENQMQLAETSTPGEMVGEMPFIFDLKHVVSIIAMEESRLMVLNKEQFLAACKMYPEDSLALKRSAMKIIQSLSGDMAVEDDDKSKSQGGSRKLKKSKSQGSFATVRTNASSSSAGSQSTTVSHALRRMYAGDLKLVMEKLRQEQAAARQELICNFIQLAADGDVGGVEATLEKNEVHVDDADYDLRTALHLSVCNGHMQVVKCLIERHNASIRVKDRFNHSPVDDAVREKKVDIVRYLVSLGAKYQVDADVSAQLCQAAYDNDIENLTMFLEDVHVNPNVSDYDKRTPLHLAASEGHLAVVELLVGIPGINLSPRDRLGNTPLDDAMRHKHASVRKYLHQHGARMGDQQIGVKLCDLAYKNDLDQLKELADSNVPLHEADYDARTALHLCASENHLSAATYLLEARTDPNSLDRFLNTPLDDAIRHGHRAMQAFLTKWGGMKGSDPKMVNAVKTFKKRKKVMDEQLATERLEKDVVMTEVCTIQKKLEALREHMFLDDDVHTFASHAMSYRSLLLQLLLESAQPKEYKQDAQRREEQAVEDALYDREPPFSTKEQREMLVERLAEELDAVCARLTNTLESEVVPWIAGLSRYEQRMLRLFTPGLEPAIGRIVEHMKSRSRLSKFTHGLWKESGPDGGCYSCTPVGYLLARLHDSPDGMGVLRARLEAASLLWVSGVTVSSPLRDEDAQPEGAGAGVAAGVAAGQGKEAEALRAPGQKAKKDATEFDSHSHYESRVLLSMLVDSDEAAAGLPGQVASLSHHTFL